MKNFATKLPNSTNVSLFKTVKITTPDRHDSLNEVLNNIRDGKYKDDVINVRKGLRKKTDCVCFTPSGNFKSRKAADIIRHNGYLLMDFDNKNADLVKKSLSKDPHTYAVFKSISGNGAAAIFKIDPKKHAQSFDEIADYLKIQYGLEIDPSCKDVSRARFISWDPGLFLNKNAKPFICSYSNTKPTNGKVKSFENLKKNPAHDLYFLRRYNQIIDAKIDITDPEPNWLKVIHALINEFGEDARPYVHGLSQFHPGYDHTECEKKFHYCLRSDEAKSHEDAKTTLGTLHWMMNNALASKNISQLEDFITKTRLNPNIELIEPPVILEISTDDFSFVPFGTKGNFSLVIGKAKSRKSFFIQMLIAAFLNSEKVLMRKIRGIADGRIMWFDTEQAPFHVQQAYRRVMHLCSEQGSSNLEVHCLRPIDTKTRLQLIEHIIYNTPGLTLVVIDGIRDLITDINDPTQATEIATKLLKWTEELNIHIITVLHQNKGDNNARGHVGTELINKAETVVSIAKAEKNTELSMVTPEYFRGKEFEPFAFSIDENGLPCIEMEWIDQSTQPKNRKADPSKIEDHQHLTRLRKAFSKEPALSYSECWRAIKAAFIEMQLSDHNAKDFLSYYLVKDWIQKMPGKKWPLYEVVQVVRPRSAN